MASRWRLKNASVEVLYAPAYPVFPDKRFSPLLSSLIEMKFSPVLHQHHPKAVQQQNVDRC